MKLLATTLAATVLTASVGCNAIDRILNPQPTYQAAGARTVVPPMFLFTRYAPLATWLDTQVRVQIIDTPLRSVFDHPALRGFHYRIIKAPKANPLVNIDRLSMTRRQLLYGLAHDHQLQMTPAYGPDGEILHIEIRSRDVNVAREVQ
jgi:hypothetical protein